MTNDVEWPSQVVNNSIGAGLAVDRIGRMVET